MFVADFQDISFKHSRSLVESYFLKRPGGNENVASMVGDLYIQHRGQINYLTINNWSQPYNTVKAR